MSTPNLALTKLRHLSLAQVRSLAKQRLTGEDSTPIEDSYWSEQPEDFVIALLTDTQTPIEVREAIIDACIDVLTECFKDFDPARRPTDALKWESTLIRLCRVLDVAAPPEIAVYADFLLAAALQPLLPSSVRKAAIRAAMSYRQSPDFLPLWEQLLRHRELAAFALNAIIDIDPQSARLEGMLVELWEKQVESNWPLDAAFLTHRAAIKRDSVEFIDRVLTSLRAWANSSSAPSGCWEAIEAIVRSRPWSAAWLERLTLKRARSFDTLINPARTEHAIFQFSDRQIFPAASYSRDPYTRAAGKWIVVYYSHAQARETNPVPPSSIDKFIEQFESEEHVEGSAFTDAKERIQ